MAIVGVGIDVVDVARFGESLDRTPGLRERLFTPDEAPHRLASLAARFAAKEARRQGARAPRWAWPGTTPRWSRRPPAARCWCIRGSVQARADELGVASVHLSLSHDAGIASAVVVLES